MSFHPSLWDLFATFRPMERSLRRFIREFYNDPFFHFEIPTFYYFPRMLEFEEGPPLTTPPPPPLPPLTTTPPPRHLLPPKTKGKKVQKKQGRKRLREEEPSETNATTATNNDNTLAVVGTPQTKKAKAETETPTQSLMKLDSDMRMEWLSARVSINDVGKMIEISAFLPGLEKNDLSSTNLYIIFTHSKK